MLMLRNRFLMAGSRALGQLPWVKRWQEALFIVPRVLPGPRGQNEERDGPTTSQVSIRIITWPAKHVTQVRPHSPRLPGLWGPQAGGQPLLSPICITGSPPAPPAPGEHTGARARSAVPGQGWQINPLVACASGQGGEKNGEEVYGALRPRSRGQNGPLSVRFLCD